MTSLATWWSTQSTDLLNAGARRWGLFLIGYLLIGTGVGGGILPSTLGAAPMDAVFAGAGDRTGLSVGTWVVVLSVALLAATAIAGTAPKLGTVLGFALLGAVIDASRALAPQTATMGGRGLQWIIGALVMAVGAGLTIASDLGASAYDQSTVVLARAIDRPLGVARLSMDAVAVAVALLLRGPIGVGTIGLLVLFPIVMPLVVTRAQRLLPASATGTASSSPTR